MALTDEQRAELTWAIAEVGCIHTGGVDHDAITGCRDCQDIAGAVEPLIARMVAEAAGQAWDEGWEDRDGDCSEPYSPRRDNPYRGGTP